jgi:hypothetical protein
MTHEIAVGTVPATALSMPTGTGGEKRGRKPGVKTVTRDKEEHRRAWLASAMTRRGANAELCCLLQAPDSFVSHLVSGRRTFTDAITARIEDVLGLTRGAIDASSDAPLKLRPVGDGAMAPRKLNLGLERALTELLRSALRDKRVSNSAAIRLIGEIVRL